MRRPHFIPDRRLWLFPPSSHLIRPSLRRPGVYVPAFNILYGFMGRLSFGHMFYLGTGPSAVTLFSEHVSQSSLLAILAVLVAGALISFAVVLVGGLGNIKGTFVSAFVLGLVMAITGRYWGPAAETMVFVVMGIVLIFKPVEV